MTTIMPESWPIPAQISDRIGESAGRQRAMFVEGHLLLVLHEPPLPNRRDRTARLLWRDPTGAWNSNKCGAVSQLLMKHVAEFTERIDGLDSQLQIAGCADDYLRLLQEIAPLHRTSRNLHATLQHARELVPDDREIILARDAAGDAERALELLHSDSRNGLDYTVARRTELQSDQVYAMTLSAHRLNILAALFFPITAISSVFGMNISSGLEGTACSARWLFWGVLLGGTLLGWLLTRLIAQKPTAVSKSAPPQQQRCVKNTSTRTDRSKRSYSVRQSAVRVGR